MRIFTSALLVGCLPLATRLMPVLSDPSSPPGAERAKPLPPEGLARPDSSSDSDELNKTPPSSNLDVNTQRWGGPNEPASDRALAVVVPVHPGYSPYRLLSSIKPRAIRCPLGTVRNADLVLYYYDNYYYPDDDGRHDDDEDDVDDRSLFDDVVYAVAGSIGRCFAEVRTVRTRLRQEEEEEGHKEQAGPTEEILSSMFYNLFLDDEVRPQFSRYDSLAVLSWDDLNADENLLASLYGAASTGAITFWVKSVVAGTGNGNSDDTGSSNDTANGSDADNGNGTGNNIGNDIGNDAGNSDDISSGNDTGDGKGKHAIGKKTSTAVDRSSTSHDVYNNNNPGFAEYVGLTYERWALLRPYKKALELTLCPPAYACYSNMFVVYDEQGSASNNEDVYADGDSSEYISDAHGFLFSSGIASLVENSKSVDRKFRNNYGGVRVSRNLPLFQNGASSPATHQGSSSGNADVDADSSEYDADDEGLLYSSGMTGMLENSMSIDWGFRDNDRGVRVSRNLRGFQKSAPPPGADQGSPSDNADAYGDVDSSEHISDDHDLLYSGGMTGLLDNSKLVDWEFRNNDGGVRVSRNLRTFEKTAPPPGAHQSPPSDNADVYDDADSSEKVYDDHGILYSSGMAGMIEHFKSVDREFRHNDRGVLSSRDLRAFQKSTPPAGADQASPSDNIDVDADVNSSEYVSDDHGIFFSSGVAVDNSKSVDREIHNTNADTFDVHAHCTPADYSEYVSDDHTLVYYSGSIMTGMVDNSKSVDREFLNNDRGVSFSRNLRTF